MRLSSSLDSVRSARQYVRRWLAARGLDGEVVDTVELLTSEIVTNAVLHARTACDVDVMMDQRHVRVDVHDDSGRVPVPRRTGRHDLSGRGLQIVQALASSWGTDLVPGDGKHVWFEVPTPGSSGFLAGC